MSLANLVSQNKVNLNLENQSITKIGDFNGLINQCHAALNAPAGSFNVIARETVAPPVLFPYLANDTALSVAGFNNTAATHQMTGLTVSNIQADRDTKGVVIRDIESVNGPVSSGVKVEDVVNQDGANASAAYGIEVRGVRANNSDGFGIYPSTYGMYLSRVGATGTKNAIYPGSLLKLADGSISMAVQYDNTGVLNAAADAGNIILLDNPSTGGPATLLVLTSQRWSDGDCYELYKLGSDDVNIEIICSGARTASGPIAPVGLIVTIPFTGPAFSKARIIFRNDICYFFQW